MFRNIKMHWRRFRNLNTLSVHGIRLHTGIDDMPKSVRSHVFKGIYEEFECAMVKKNVHHGDQVLEIGTGIGLVSLLVTKIAGEGNVVSYEANPDLEETIRANYKLNGWEPNLIMNAVTSDGRDLVFHQDPNILSSSAYDRDLDTNTITVPSMPFEKLLDQHNPNVLVIDIEGAEIEILPDASLDNVRVMVIELHPHIVGEDKIEELLNILETKGLKMIEKQHKTYLLLRN
jgi:FkbM family methyltransferase